MTQHLFLTILLTWSIALADDVPCGDGPTPWQNLPAYSGTPISMLAGSEIRDYSVLESAGQLVYSDHRSNLIRWHADTGVNEILSKGTPGMSQLKDPLERYLLSTNGLLLWDLQKMRWLSSNVSSDDLTPLYWESGSLYYFQKVRVSESLFEYSIVRFYPKRSQVKSVCSVSSQLDLTPFAEAKYPGAYAFSTVPSGNKFKIEEYSITPGLAFRCKIAKEESPKWEFEGQVKSAHRVGDSLESSMMYFGNVRKNIFWKSPEKCGFLDEPSSVVKIPGPNGYFASYDEKSGLALLNPQMQTRVLLQKNLSLRKFSSEDFWLSDDGLTLYYRPQLLWQRPQTLLMYRLP